MRLSTLLCIAVLLAITPLYAQIDNGNITGRVTDQSGAVIPGAQVTVTQTAMNFETVTQTNEEGLYRAVQLRPGPYRVTVVAQGFKRYVREQIELRMGETLAINVPMEVGAVADSIEVKANAQLLETETSSTGQVLAGDYFYSLPIYQRNVKNILYYTPGLTYSGMNWAGSLGSMHINGLRATYIGYFEDGAYGSTPGDGITTDTILNTIEDIKVLTTTLPAEYGHSAGGAISVVKKSGTNELHGIASMYGRTRRLQHRKFFDLYRNSQATPPYEKPPGLLFYQPDANLSGPVYIPKVYDGRNKTFFMVAYQWMIEKQSKQQVSTVPTPEMLNGDFSFGGVGQPIYDPRSTAGSANNWTRLPFAGNIVPKNAWSNVAKTVLATNPFLPQNRIVAPTSTGVSGNILTGPIKIVRWDNMSFRLDQQFGPNLKAFLTWTGNSRWERQPPWTKVAGNMFDSSQNIAHRWMNTWGAGLTWLVSPTVVSDFRASLWRDNQKTDSITYMQDYASKLGIKGLPKDAMPQIWVGLSGSNSESLNVGNPSTNIQENITVKDDVSKASGKHAFKFGYELMRFRQNNYGTGNPDGGTWNYVGTNGIAANGTGISNTGNNLATFMVGAISSVTGISRTLNSSLPRVWQHSFYMQDDWKIHPNLTLNLGVRYSFETPPVQKYGIISIWDPNAVDDSLYTNYTCPAGGCKGAWTHPKGARPYDWDMNRIDPRVGLAWHPLQKWVFRGGFALTHIDMRAGFLNTDEMMSDTAANLSQATGVPLPLFMLDAGVPSSFGAYPAHRADGSVPYAGNPTGHNATIVSRNMQAAYTMSWNASIQYELGKDYLIEAGYRGSSQVRNSGGYEYNSRPWAMIPNPNGSGWMDLNDPANLAYRTSWLSNTSVSRPWTNWNNITVQGNNGHLTHHEGTAKLEKRFSKGLTFLTFYTFSKTLDGNSFGNAYIDWGLNKGRADWNQTHVFTGTMNYDIPVGKGRKFMNRGGWLDYLLGGYNFVWTYNLASGSPIGMSISGVSPTQNNYPGYMGTYGDVMLLKVPKLRDNWQDIGGDRFTQQNQNSMVDCGTFVQQWGNDCMTYIRAFTRGNNGRNLWDRQRIISANMSASKEIPIKERLKFQFRFDFQNPFKWYNWGSPSTGLNVSSVANAKTFGTTTPGSEATAATTGGLPLMNITLAFKW